MTRYSLKMDYLSRIKSNATDLRYMARNEKYPLKSVKNGISLGAIAGGQRGSGGRRIRGL